MRRRILTPERKISVVQERDEAISHIHKRVREYLDVTQRRINSEWHIPQASDRYLRIAEINQEEFLTYSTYFEIPLVVAGATCVIHRDMGDEKVPYTPKEVIRIATYVRGLPQQAMRWYPPDSLEKFNPKRHDASAINPWSLLLR